jgi:PleD family two-component response regulator
LDLISRNERTAALPVLALSTDAELDTVQKAFRAGARDFLVLPYDPLTLDRKVEQLVAEQATARA